MATYDAAFQPGPTVTQNLAVTAGAASITINNLNRQASARTIRAVNSGGSAIFVAFDTTATTTQGMMMLPNTVESFTLPSGSTTISALSTTTGNTLYITVGDGM